MRFCAFFLAAFPFLAAAQQDWRFAHPDATLVGSIRPQELLNSPLLGAALADVQKDPNTAAMLGMARGVLGGIAEIRFSIQDNGTPEPDVIAVVRGKLDEALVGMMAQGKVQSKRIDADTLLIASPASLDAAAERMVSTAAKLQSRALSSAEALEVFDLWISGKLPDTPITSGLNLNLRGLALGANLREGLELQLSMDTANATQAEALVKSAHEAEAAQPVQFRGFLQSFVDGHTARFRMSIPKDRALDLIRTRGTTPLPGLSAAATPPPPPIAPRRGIVIDGLEGGPKELPIQ